MQLQKQALAECLVQVSVHKNQRLFQANLVSLKQNQQVVLEIVNPLLLVALVAENKVII